MSGDDTASGLRAPFVVWALTIAMVGSFAAYSVSSRDVQQQILMTLALIPERFHGNAPDRYLNWAEAATPILGHVFTHANWLHVGLNTFFFFGAARTPASRLGALRFLILFFFSAAAGALAFLALNWGTQSLAVGASGAVCGVFTAFYFSLRPTWREALAVPEIRNQLGMLVFLNVVVMGIVAQFGWLPVAWEAHGGGFLGGALAYVLLSRPGRPVTAN
jgi:membrane associated rhomboid family serine protease